MVTDQSDTSYANRPLWMQQWCVAATE